MLAALLLAFLAALPCVAAGATPGVDAAVDVTTAAPLPPQPPEALPDLGEVEVTGEQPGPALWKVTRPAANGGAGAPHVLWILGTLRPLPRKMEWRPTAVERALMGAEVFIPYQPDIDVKAGPFAMVGLFFSARSALKDPDGQPLRETLPAPLYARFAALKARYAPRDSGMEKRRPAIAAIELYGEALDAMKLSQRLDVEGLVARQARKRGVKVRPVKVEMAEPKAVLAELSALPRPAELACVEATLARLETDLGPMRARAEAWALGDLEALRRLPFPAQETTCGDAVATSPRFKALLQQARAGWLDAVSAALRQNAVSVATAPVQSLLRAGGIADQLAARGFVVEAPTAN
ncbi:MAG: hypothetical protein RJB26_73 [Pseudomonadota bacterium]